MAQVQLHTLVGDPGTAADILRQAGIQLLHQVHHALVIGVGLVQLHGGEFGVVLGIHTLIAEDASHLVHTIQAAHDEPLEVKLGLNAQVHIHIQRIVVGHKGPGGSADLQRYQDGGIYLQEALLIQVAADLGQDAAALIEGIPHLRVHNKVHIALAVPGIGIPQPMEFLRQRQQGLGKQLDMGGMNRDLALLGTEHGALHAQDITDIPLLKVGIVFLAHIIPAHIYLQPSGGIQQIHKAGLTHHAAAHHAAGNAYRFALQRLKVIPDLLVLGIPVIFRDLIGVLAGFAQCRQLVPAHLYLFVQALLFFLGLRRRVHYLFFAHILSSFTGAGIPAPSHSSIPAGGNLRTPLRFYRAAPLRRGRPSLAAERPVFPPLPLLWVSLYSTIKCPAGQIKKQKSSALFCLFAGKLLADVQNDHLEGAAGGFHHHGLTLFMANKRMAYGGLVGNGVHLVAHFHGANDEVLTLFLHILIQHLHLGANPHHIQRKAVGIHDGHMLQLLFQHGNAGFYFRLLVFGSIVFTVFGKVAVAAGDLYFLCDLAAFGRFQLFQLFGQLIIAGLGHLNGVYHEIQLLYGRQTVPRCPTIV